MKKYNSPKVEVLNTNQSILSGSVKISTKPVDAGAALSKKNVNFYDDDEDDDEF